MTTSALQPAAGPTRFPFLPLRVFAAASLLVLTAVSGLAGPKLSLEQPVGTSLGGSVVAWGANDDGVGQTNVPANLTGVKAISAGSAHTLALKADGTVVGFGDNSYYQLDVPANLTGVAAVAAGNNTSLAVKSDGTVVEWGDDSFGQLTVPANLTGVAAVSVGFSHVLALKNDSTVTAWGSNDGGQTAVPANLTGVTKIAAGSFHSVALKSDGTVVAWGTITTYDNNGNPTGTQTAPAAVVPNGLSGVTAIAAGGSHTLALKSNGTVVAWGDNSSGQITIPANLTDVVAIGAGRVNSVAVKSDGTVVVWGDTFSGEGTIPASASGAVAVTAGNYFIVALTQPKVSFGAQAVASAAPVKTFTIKDTGDATLNITSVSVTGGNAGDFAVNTTALTSSVGSAGSTTFTVTFTPNAAGPRQTTLRVVSDDASQSIVNVTLTGTGGNAGGATIEITRAGGAAVSSRVVAWGSSDYGETNVPAGLTGVQAISAGENYSLALKSDGTVVAWGNNSFGGTDVPAGLTGVLAISAGLNHSLALKSDGTVVAWGYDRGGETNVPAGLTGVQAIAAGGYFSLALKSDGTAVAWGYRGNGRTDVPAGLTGVQAISAGLNHGLALKSDGTVVAWGNNYNGETNVPAGLTGVQAIAAGGSLSLALKSDGTVVAWGDIYNGTGETNVAAGLTGVQAISVGGYHSLALKSDGIVVAWGDNFYGQTNVPAALTGVQAIAAGEGHNLALTKGGLVFADQPVDTASAAQTITIANTGDQPLHISSVTLADGDAADFDVDTTELLTTIPPAGQTTVSVTFTPSFGGTRHTTLRVVSDAANKSSYDLDLTGKGLGSSNAKLVSLDSGAALTPSFAPAVTKYAATVPFETTSVAVTPTTAEAKAIITVNGVAVDSGSASDSIPLKVGANTIRTVVSASDAATTRTYTVTIHRAPPASPVLPSVVTSDESAVDLDGATLNGTVNANGFARVITFDYGKSTSYGGSIAATPGTLATDAVTPVSATLTGLRPHTEYHFRVRASGDYGTAIGADGIFTTGNTAPVAVDDTLMIAQPVSVLNVVANDTDADADNAFFTVAAITTPLPKTAGTLKLAKGQLTFTASKTFLAGTAGPATFAYRMSDGFGGTSTATVTLTYSSSSISITPTTRQIAAEDDTYTILVISAGPWTVAGAPAWAKVTPSTGDSSTPFVEVTVAANTAKKARTAVFTIGGVTHTLTQAGVEKPEIGPMTATDYDAIVGGQFSLEIPTENGPVKYTAKGLPKGLKLADATGFIAGVPTVSGDFAVTVAAKNATAAADATLSFTIHVAPLAPGVVGTFHGLIERSSELNGILGSRLELTTTATGSYSGKIITGSKATSIKGLLSADVSTPSSVRVLLPIPALNATLDLTLDDATDSLTGTLGDDDDNAAGVNGWRNAWAGLVDKAADVAGKYSFLLEQPDADDTLPQGYSTGSFTVDAATGAVKLTGKLADGSAISGTTFVGQDGQVLVYTPLYGGKGSIAGVLTITPGANAPADHTIEGNPDWYKPASDAKAKDLVYADGFGPLPLTADGGTYTAPTAGALVLDLTAGDSNATLAFTLGGLDAETKEFEQAVTIANPKATGVTNTATIGTSANGVKVSALDTSSGVLAGKFTLDGGREASFYGQIVTTADGPRGYGYFLLPQVPLGDETVKTAPKLSGQLILSPATP